jgi:16S rRNA U516 pseudouridylate synthase RsuA-like enzyme
MTAAVGFPTLRLIRVGIQKLKINQFPLGTVTEITLKEIQ